MNDVLEGLARGLFRVTVGVAGLLFFMSLLAAAALLALGWALRTLWARLTGQPVTPWVLRVHPRAGWHTVYRASAGFSARNAPDGAPTSPEFTGRGQALPGAGEITDVEPRDLR